MNLYKATLFKAESTSVYVIPAHDDIEAMNKLSVLAKDKGLEYDFVRVDPVFNLKDLQGELIVTDKQTATKEETSKDDFVWERTHFEMWGGFTSDWYDTFRKHVFYTFDFSSEHKIYSALHLALEAHYIAPKLWERFVENVPVEHWLALAELIVLEDWKKIGFKDHASIWKSFCWGDTKVGERYWRELYMLYF